MARLWAHRSLPVDLRGAIRDDHHHLWHPQLIIQPVANADADSSTVDATQVQQVGITIQPCQDLVDVLYAWADKPDARITSMTEWQATWQAYFVPATSDSHPTKNVTDPSGAKVYSNVVCTPDTLY